MCEGWKNLVRKIDRGIDEKVRGFQRGGEWGTDGIKRKQGVMGIPRKTRSRSTSNAAVLNSSGAFRLALVKCRRFRRVLRGIPITPCFLLLPGY